jgi:hypothetical protein
MSEKSKREVVYEVVDAHSGEVSWEGQCLKTAREVRGEITDDSPFIRITCPKMMTSAVWAKYKEKLDALGED